LSLKQEKRRLVIGLTGGLASGKSTVLQELARRGIQTVSADRLAHECLKKGHPTYRRIVEHFGPGILNLSGQINRETLGAIVFAHPAERKRLERWIHPYVKMALKQWIAQHEGLLVLDIPLLFEAHMQSLVDMIVVVSSSQVLQRRRMVRRDGLTPREATRRIHAQMPLARKRAQADYVVRNDGSLQRLRRHAARLASMLRQRWQN
jgi:dephospho-CoA kinase